MSNLKHTERTLLKLKIQKAEKDLENKDLFRQIVDKSLQLQIFGGKSEKCFGYQFGIGVSQVNRFRNGLSMPLPPIVKCIYRVIKRGEL